MSTITKNKTPKGIRYTDAQKKEVIDFALSYNAANGRGGQSKAAEKFKISQITIAGWLKGASASAPKESTADKPAKAPKVTTKAAKPAKEPKPAKAAKAPKAPKAPKATKSKAGTRYTDEQKKEVTDFVASYNAANGRGGQSKAAEKFSVSPLTVMTWLKASGGKTKTAKVAKKGGKSAAPAKAAKEAKAVKAAKPVSYPVSSSFDDKLTTLLALSKEISRAESQLAQLNAKFKSLKASL